MGLFLATLVCYVDLAKNVDYFLGTLVCYVDLARNGTFPGHGDYFVSLAQRESGVCWARGVVWRTEQEMRTLPRHA